MSRTHLATLAITMCVALLLAGCAARSSTTAATTARTGAAAGSRPQAEAVAVALLADFAAPPGARKLASAPGIDGGVLDQPTSVIVSSAEVDQVAWWLAPGQPQALLSWERGHLPRGLSPGDQDFGPPSEDQMFQLALAPRGITDAELVVKVASAGNGQTGIRVDAEVAWQPARPASEVVPATARVVTLSEVAVIDKHPPLPAPVTITSAAVAARIAALVNGLELSTIYGASCPPAVGNELVITFRPSTTGPVLAAAQGPGTCGTVQLAIHGTPQPALQITASFTQDVLTAAGLRWPAP